MKRYVWAAATACLALAACEPLTEPLDGDWEAMKWSHPKYKTVMMDGYSYYFVPADGGSYSFRCKNYKPWLTDHIFEVNGEIRHSYMDVDHNERIWNYYQNDWCRVDVADDSVKIQFAPNTGNVRKAVIGVTAGDIFDCFEFLQQSAIHTERAK